MKAGLWLWNNAVRAPWVDWVLGLDRVGSTQGPTLLGWRYGLPLWAWVAIVAAAVALAGWSYAGLIGPRWPKAFLGTVRALLLVFFAVLLAGPTWVQKHEEVEPDRLLLLVDRSALDGD